MQNPNTKLELTPINHVAFVIDESGSMRQHAQAVVRVFDEQVKTLAKRSVELNQETRVSLYVFNGNQGVRCVVYDRDVLRLPSLRGNYGPQGGTPLARATATALGELSKTPELHADHAFLLYAITDGEETEHTQEGLLKECIEKLSRRDNWTIAALVPDALGRDKCRRLGFTDGNIQRWDADDIETASAAMTQSTERYMTMRAAGQRSTTGLFVAQVVTKRSDVIAKLKAVTNPYSVFTLPTTSPRKAIKDFVEAKTGRDYVVGSAYYQLVKPEIIQANKRICLRTVPDGRLFSGSLAEVRSIIGLPPGGDVKVAPGEVKDFVVFVESTSVNRNIIPGQEVLVMKL